MLNRFTSTIGSALCLLQVAALFGIVMGADGSDTWCFTTMYIGFTSLLILQERVWIQGGGFQARCPIRVQKILFLVCLVCSSGLLYQVQGSLQGRNLVGLLAVTTSCWIPLKLLGFRLPFIRVRWQNLRNLRGEESSRFLLYFFSLVTAKIVQEGITLFGVDLFSEIDLWGIAAVLLIESFRNDMQIQFTRRHPSYPLRRVVLPLKRLLVFEAVDLLKVRMFLSFPISYYFLFGPFFADSQLAAGLLGLCGGLVNGLLIRKASKL